MATTPFWTQLVASIEILESGADPGESGTGATHTDSILMPGVPFSSLITGDTDHVWYRFIAEGGKVYRAETLDSPNPDFDTYIAIFDAAGNVMGTNEDVSEEDFRSRIDFYAPYSGVVYVFLGGAAGSADAPWDAISGSDVLEDTMLTVTEL